MLIEKLSNAFGPSGCEREVRSILQDALRDHVETMETDALGNLIGRVPGTEFPDTWILLAAHMDEVGFMVGHVEDSGLLRFVKVGAIDDRVLPGKRVLVGKDRIPGVIAVKPVHLTTPEERNRLLKAEDLVIDIGATSKSEAENAAPKGAYAVFATTFEAEDGLLRGKALDDRIGCAVLAELVRRGPYPCTIIPVFTTMEEIGGRGARVAAARTEPHAAFVFEGTVCDEAPRKRDVSPTTRLGAGPALTVADRSVVADRRLLRLVLDTAERHGIPVQLKQPGIGGTDAGPIHLAGIGVPSLPVSVPCRYIHGPVSIATESDFGAVAELMQRVLEAFRPDVLDPAPGA